MEELKGANAQTQKRKKSHSRPKMPDGGMFIGFALFGFLALLIMKLQGISPLVSAAVALVTLAVYAATSMRCAYGEENPERIGDNCYYLGFLFTLASLSAALIEIEGAREGRGQVIERVVSDFGVALTSTIAGIMARVTLMQMGGSQSVVDASVKSGIEHELAAIAQVLEGITFDASQFRDKIRAALESELNSMVAYNQEAVKKMGAEAENIASSIQRIGAGIGAAEMPVAQIARNLDLVQRKLNATADRLSSLSDIEAKRQETLARMADDMSELHERVFDFEPIDKVNRASNSLAEAVKLITDQIRLSGPALSEMGDQLRLQVEQARQDAALIGRLKNELSKDLEASHRTLGELQGALADMAHALSKQLVQ
jgi:hypothetical protein